MRPLAAAQDASPAPLRLALRPKPGGLEIEFVKRRGPQRDEPLFLPMQVGSTHVFKPRLTSPDQVTLNPATQTGRPKHKIIASATFL